MVIARPALQALASGAVGLTARRGLSKSGDRAATALTTMLGNQGKRLRTMSDRLNADFPYSTYPYANEVKQE
jgi:hypothetical protein